MIIIMYIRFDLVLARYGMILRNDKKVFRIKLLLK